MREFKSNGEIIETCAFSLIEINASIPDKVFDFSPPKGVDVILHDAQ